MKVIEALGVQNILAALVGGGLVVIVAWIALRVENRK